MLAPEINKVDCNMFNSSSVECYCTPKTLRSCKKHGINTVCSKKKKKHLNDLLKAEFSQIW